MNRMKTKKTKSTVLLLLASIVISLSFSSCAVKNQFLTSTVVPAAQGTVLIKQDKNMNYVIKIELSNLSPSTRLSPPATAYIVWSVNADNTTQSLGQLNSSTGFMTKDLSAKMETISVTKPVKIFITSENDVSTQYPSYSNIILTTEYLK